MYPYPYQCNCIYLYICIFIYYLALKKNVMSNYNHLHQELSVQDFVLAYG